MKAWQTVSVGDPKDALVLNPDAPEPEPYPGTVLLEVQAAGVGLPDVLMCKDAYAMTPQRPFTQGQEVVGRIVGWGEGVENRNVGDRVMAVTSFFTGAGSYAEKCLALDDFCLPVPDEMSDAEGAAFLIPFHTAYLGLETRAALKPDETLLVLGGAGGTGSAALQVGKALGAKAIAVVAGPEKVEFCKRLGADLVIDRREADIAEAVMAETAGQGANVIYDPVGGDAFTRATKCVAHEGRILAVGFASGQWGQVETAHMVMQNYSVIGVIPTNYGREYKEAAQERLLAWYRSGQLTVEIDELVPFDALPDALERLGNNEVKGKLAIAVSADATTRSAKDA
ncbi:MAG: NADPH:quinone oxidoreductase family protein [Myxococcota bacterium]